MPARVQSVERAAAILQALSAENRPTSLAHLADTLGLAKATVHGLVQTLRDVGFVDQDPDSGLYAVGAGLLQLGATTLDHNELRARALNWTDALAARTGQAALLGTLDGDRVAVVHHVFRPDGSRQTSLTGTVQPLHVDALGKVLLAHDPRALRRLAGRELESHTYRTITDPASLRRELADVRDHGWAAAVEEAEPEAVGLAAPVRDRAGFVVAAVGVVGRVDGLCDGRQRPRQALVTQVVSAGRSISRELGHGRP
ncbi:IclR family transcriptional regulator [Nocardioides sp. MAHUQ-72]|uniref:IclR family transcriptional regulator n=1 Tax=unclassified Nocardioides TaxID=2615069 RepID=UPI00361E2444